MKNCDVTVIGGGPAGLAAALAANKNGAYVRLIEREEKLGGILKQCIHDGFGLLRFGEKLSGPEYVERYIDEFMSAGIEYMTFTFVTDMKKTDEGFDITVVSRDGVDTFSTKSIILATGCRERTAKQVAIHGTRPAGVFTAGAAQNLVNLHGQMVTKKCVILGSGDIGMIMARRLTLEGAKVVGVYEVKPEPSGLTRNVVQCLDDFGIPLHLSHTVTRVFGHGRLEAVEVAQVDEKMQAIPGTEEIIECDALILSVGLIPENELAEGLGVQIDPRTKGPVCDDSFMTSVEGVFSCGNCLHVNDLVDYVSESGDLAGKAAASYSLSEKICCDEVAELKGDAGILYIVPQKIRLDAPEDPVIYFRASQTVSDALLEVTSGDELLLKKRYMKLRPPEMEKIVLKLDDIKAAGNKVIELHVSSKEA